MVHSGHIIELSDAVALLGDFPALAGLDLEVAKGEVICVEGPNGAGKSTLLRLCAGLLPLHTGSGVVLGKDLANRDERRELRRQAGLLAHETFLYDELSIIDNITFWAKANRSDLSTIEPVLDRLGLDGRLRTVKARDLSAGQRRRTSLAIMISRRPHIWLLDEPHAALDQAGKDAVDSLIKQAVGFGATVLLASHDRRRARAVATRVVNVSGGRILQTPASEQSESSVEATEPVAVEEPPSLASTPAVSALPGRPITKGFVNSSTTSETTDNSATSSPSPDAATEDGSSPDEQTKEPKRVIGATNEPVEEPTDSDDSVDDLFADLLAAERPPSLLDDGATKTTSISDDDPAKETP